MTPAFLVVVEIVVAVWAFFVSIIVWLMWKQIDDKLVSMQKRIEQTRKEIASR